jgi:4-hydroxy-2-oxoheptanedioate aldolase
LFQEGSADIVLSKERWLCELRQNNLKKTLQEGKAVFGPFLKLADPAVVEIFAHAGFDFVIIDLEHGPLSIETAQNMVRAAELAGITPIIRVSENDPAQISRALDIGAQGVQIPHITSAAEADLAVRAAKFAPLGNRGVCRFVRASKYSAMERNNYFTSANENTLVIAMVEGIEGVRNIEDILATPGVDVIFIGPYDLSQSLGLLGQVSNPKVFDELKKVTERARSKRIAVGTFADSIELAKIYRGLGINYISYSVDTGLFFEAISQLIKQLKS